MQVRKRILFLTRSLIQSGRDMALILKSNKIEVMVGDNFIVGYVARRILRRI